MSVTEYTPARLAKLTGLPNLETVVDPEHLERLVRTAQSMRNSLELRCPLRYKVALRQYIRQAIARLGDPKPFCSLRGSYPPSRLAFETIDLSR